MGSNPIQIANASVAQSVEQGTENPRVIGSIPIGGTKEYVVLSAEADEEAAYSFLADLAHLVERHLAKVEVASSSLIIRSIALYYLFHYKDRWLPPNGFSFWRRFFVFMREFIEVVGTEIVLMLVGIERAIGK